MTNGKLEARWIPSTDMAADGLTKVLLAPQHKRLGQGSPSHHFDLNHWGQSAIKGISPLPQCADIPQFLGTSGRMEQTECLLARVYSTMLLLTTAPLCLV